MSVQRIRSGYPSHGDGCSTWHRKFRATLKGGEVENSVCPE